MARGPAHRGGLGRPRTKDTYLQAKVWRVTGPRADADRRDKAAVAHMLLIAAYYLTSNNDAVYHKIGADHFTRRDGPARRSDRLVAQLANLGYDVELTPTAA